MAKASTKTLDSTVDPDECRIAGKGERLIARHVSSDIVLAIHAPTAGFAALMRFSSHDSRLDVVRATQNPWCCADTGTWLLLESAKSMGIDLNDLSVFAVGGAVLPAPAGSASAGQLNQAALRNVLKGEGLHLKGEDLGGNVLRSLWFETDSGRIIVRTAANRISSIDQLPDRGRNAAWRHRAS
jgi:chemotaxis receptor (MCP) glutamine deamidase CheD